MTNDKKMIEILNEVLAGELAAINQYFLHARMCQDWGYEVLAKVVREESIDEMKHAQAIIDRILFLKGVPNVRKMEEINIGESVPEQFDLDLKLEVRAIERLKRGIAYSFESADHTSRELLESILDDEEKHYDWLDTQICLIGEVGKENYLSQQIR